MVSPSFKNDLFCTIDKAFFIVLLGPRGRELASLLRPRVGSGGCCNLTHKSPAKNVDLEDFEDWYNKYQ